MAANYLYVVIAVPALPTTFQVYLVLGAVWWSLATAAAYKLLAARQLPHYERHNLYRPPDEDGES